MMRHIRPWKLFALVPEKDAARRIVQMKIPIRRNDEFSDYSLRLLELMSVIACMRIVNAVAMFEFGTFCGNTTLHMAVNSSDDARIWTLDADDETLERIGLREIYAWRANQPPEWKGTGVGYKIHPLRGDSHTLDCSRWRGRIDLVLIDGDHSGAGVLRDTVNAEKMLRAGGCILWHDYGNPGCHENTAYLDERSETHDLFHIEDSMLVVEFKDEKTVRALLEVRR